MTPREAMRDVLAAAGEAAAMRTMRRYYETCRRHKLLGEPPAPPQAHDMLWSARHALIKLDRHTRMWEIGREIDCKLLAERDGR